MTDPATRPNPVDSAQANPVDSTLVLLFQHKAWATVSLIEHCRSLDDAQLTATIPGGAFGSIHATLQHLVAGDEGYFERLTGQRFTERLRPEPLVPLAELAERMRRLSPHWEALARDPDVHNQPVTTRDGWSTRGAVLMAQAIHHADDHRSQVLSIIGANGLRLPGLDIAEDLDVWHHGMATGLMRQIAASPSS